MQPMVARVSHLVELDGEVAALRADQARFPAPLRQIDGLEQRYEGLRALFAPDRRGAPSELWLPPPASTQGLLDDEAGPTRDWTSPSPRAHIF